MVNERLARLYRRWVSGVRPTGTARPRLRAPLRLEQVEERVTPTVLPAPTVSGQQTLFTPLDTVQAWYPQIINPVATPVDTTNIQAASDPLNSLRQVFVAQRLTDAADPQDSSSIVSKFSVDGGFTWTTFGTAGATKYPDTTTSNPVLSYRFNLNPVVAMDRNNQIYIAWLQQNRAGTAGVIGVDRFNWVPGEAPVQVDLDPTDRFGFGNKSNLIYTWKGQQALNPTIVINNNPATFTDPDSGKTNVDPSTGSIYIAWNSINPQPATITGNYNPNRVQVMSSSDKGLSFAGHQFVDDAGFATFPDFGATTPQLAIAPITSDAPGALFVGFSRTTADPNKVATLVDLALTQPASFDGNKQYTAVTGAIIDAIDPGNGAPHIAKTTDFPINISGLPANFSLTDVDVTLAIQHKQIDQVKIQLVSPVGTAYTLLNNRVDTAGTASTATPPAGLGAIAEPDSLGIYQGLVIGTTFDDSSSRLINDPNSTSPYLGNYAPEANRFGTTMSGTFQGLNQAQAQGNWIIRITDNRADNPPFPAFIRYASIRLMSGVGGTGVFSTTNFGADVAIPVGGLYLPAGTGLNSPFIPASGLSPTVGIGPGLSMAADSSLAAIGANGLVVPQLTTAGRVYAALASGVDANGDGILQPTEDIDISLAAISTKDLRNDITGKRNPPVFSLINPKVNQDAPSDNKTEGNRYQFGPSLAVDPKTGTLAASWFDARNDASNARVARYFATSINGGATFSPERFFNLPKTATDAVTGQSALIEPVPDNLATAGAQGFGVRQSLLFDSGRLNAFWSGNQNNTRGGVYTAQAQTAVGPRIIYADMGPVTALSQRQYTTPIAPQQPAFFVYNNTLAADGTRQIDGFRVVFDRPVDVTSFTPDDIRVYYTAPDPNAVDGGGNALVARELRELLGVGYQIFDLSDSTNPLLPIPPGQTVNTIGPNRDFFVRFIDPATAGDPIPTARPVSMVGTYSYTVGTLIRDRIRTEVPVRPTNPPPPAGTPGNPGEVLDVAPVQPAPGSVFDTPFVNSTFTPIVSRPYDPPPGTGNPQPPAVNPWEAGPDNRGVTVSTLDLPALPAGQVIARLQVTVDLVHTRRGAGTQGLIIQLVGPSNQVVTLSRLRGGNGSSYDTFALDNVTFDDSAAFPISVGSGTFSGTFRPDGLLPTVTTKALPGETPLSEVGLGAFRFQDTAGTWTLRIIDNYNADNQFAAETPLGYLRSWSLRVIPGVIYSLADNGGYGPASTAASPNNSVRRGNAMDQDADANPWEPGDDLFAAPRSGRRNVVNVAGAPLVGGFDKGTLPLSIPGPRITGISVSATGTFSAAVEPVYVNTGASRLFIRFDRDMLTATAGTDTKLANATVSLVGPTGPIALPNARVLQTTPGDLRSFTVDFGQTLKLAGQYSLKFGPNIKSAMGDGIDPDANAGVDTLFGGNLLTSVIDSKVYQNTTPVTITSAPAVGTTSGFAVTGEAVAEIAIPVADAFQIAQDLTRFPNARVKLDLSVTDDDPTNPLSLFSPAANLQAVLVAPDGTRVKLFTALASPGTVTTNIQFDDNALLPIQGGVDPFRTQPYKPQFPLASLLGKWSQGTWKVVISHQLFRFNPDTNLPNPIGTINFARLTLTRPVLSPNPTGGVNTGTGQIYADEQTVPFRVFNQDPSGPEASELWTPLGGAPTNNQANAGRVTSVTVDPADPSGNTVYAAGASGGVWKTTNFLTTDPRGPSWIPLTDFGPNNSLNIASITVIPRSADPVNRPADYDPTLTLVFALTGEGNFFGRGPGNTVSTVPGVGVLRSVDGGRTWDVLDSTSNADPTGAILPINAAGRDRRFVGTSGFKIVADPVPLEVGLGVRGTALNNTALYMALSGGTGAGIWRSKDTGRTWELLRGGNATDVALAPGSAGPEGNLQVLYAAMAGDGVYFTSQATTLQAGTLNERRGGGLLNNLIRDQQRNDAAVGVNNSASFPAAGSFNRLTLAVPAFTNSPLLNQTYQSWLYALASNADGTLNGLYMTKDFGRNWTRVIIPQFTDGSGNVWGTNNETAAAFDPNPTNRNNIQGVQAEAGKYVRVNGQGGVANLTNTIALDPLNPNIVYLGGERTIRVDTTAIKDPQAFYVYDFSQAGVGAAPVNSSDKGAITFDASKLPRNLDLPPQLNPSVLKQVQGTQPSPLSPSYGAFVGFINLARDPDNPFLTPSTIPVNNALAFTNTGENAYWQHFNGITGPSRDVYEITPFVDPLTGRTRLIFGTANGVYTGVDRGDGTLVTAITTPPAGANVPLTQASKVITGTRNGNLQIGQYYSGAVQPSRLAADIAGALFYAVSQDNGFLVTRPDVIESGIVSNAGEWTSGTGPGTGIDVATDQTGSGTGYQYRVPSASVSSLPTDFFRLLLPGGNHAGTGVSRTSGLIQAGDDPTVPGAGQWSHNDIRFGYFAVNPLDRNGVVISSSTGQVFRTQDAGQNWQPIGSPAGATYLRALAFGGVNPNAPTQFNNYILAGSTDGRVFYTVTGQNNWVQVADPGGSLAGRPVLKIIPNPRPQANATPTAPATWDAYVLTDRGVFYTADVRAGGFTNLTGNLFSIQDPYFVGTGQTVFANKTLTGVNTELTAMAVDWRYTTPVVYVAGQGGVFRLANASKNSGWTVFPDNPASSAYPDGGYLPNARVTDLDLSLGTIDPTTGMPFTTTDPVTNLPRNGGGLNLLVATTYGRGQWGIRINPQEAVYQDPTNPVYNPIRPDAFVSGPRVRTLATADAKTGTNLNPAAPVAGGTTTVRVIFDTSVDPVTFNNLDVTLKAPDGTAIPQDLVTVRLVATVPQGQPEPRNVYDISFPTPASNAVGFYFLRIGDPTTGPLVTDLAGNRMNQNGNLINGEPASSPNGDDNFTSFVYLYGQDNSLFVSGLPSKVSTWAPTTFKVTAIDKFGSTNAGFTGQVSFTSTDANAVLPGPYTFAAGDNGSKAFTVDFRNGSPNDDPVGLFQTITVTTLDATYNPGRIGTNVLNARYDVSGFTRLPTNEISTWDPQDLTARLLDFNGRLLQAYTGVTTLSSSDPDVIYLTPNPVQYTSGVGKDNGVRVHTPVFRNQGVQTLTFASDFGVDPLTLTETVRNAKFVVTGIPDPVSTWDPRTISVQVQSQDGRVLAAFNSAVGDRATVSFTNSDPNPLKTAPAPYTYDVADAGTKTFTRAVQFLTAGKQTLTVAGFGVDTLDLSTTVKNAQFALNGLTNPVSTWDPKDVTVRVLAFDGTPLPYYGGTVTFATTDPNGSVPGAYLFQPGPAADNGTKLYPAGVMFLNKGPQAVTLKSAAGGDPVGGVNPLTVGTVVQNAQFRIVNLPGTVTAGDPNGFLLNIVDLNGTVLPAFAGAVSFGSNDTKATLPAPNPYTYRPGVVPNGIPPATPDNGSKSFVVTYRTAGTKNLSVVTPLGVDPINPNDFTVTVVAAAASRLTVSGFPGFPGTYLAGTPGSFTVTAFDQFDNVATGYDGTVNLSTGDAKAVGLPLVFNFDPNSPTPGTATFTGVELRTAGTQTILAQDFVNNLTAAQTDILVVAKPAVAFSVSGFPNPTTAGQVGDIVVSAVDPYGNTDTKYANTVTFTSTDPQSTAGNGLPADFTFTAAQAGKAIFSGNSLKTAGLQTITVTELGGGITGSQTNILVNPGAPSKFAVSGFPDPVQAGTAGQFQVAVTDAFNNPISDYTGTVRFTSSDTLASLPVDYTFIPSDKGVKGFIGILLSTGEQSITVTDTLRPGVTGSQTGITVTPSPARSLTASGFPGTITAGVPGSITVTLFDQFGNVATGFTGSVTFTSSDKAAVLPGRYVFEPTDKGTRTFTNVVLRTAGPQTITVTPDLPTVNPGVLSSTVQPAAATVFTLTGFPSPVDAGAAGTFRVTAKDQFGNVATGYTGSVRFTSSDPDAVLPGVSNLTNGSASFIATLKTAGTQSLTVIDTADATLTGTQSGIVVSSTPVNPDPTPPVISDIGTVQVVRNTNSGPIGFTVADALTPADKLVVTVISSDLSLFPAAGLVLGGAGANRTLTITPAANRTGAATITVTVRNQANLTTSDSFVATVVAPPPPPIVPLVPSKLLAVGVDLALLNRARMYDPSGVVVREFRPFEPGYSVGTRVATARQQGGVEYLVAVPGQGRPSDVRVFDPFTGNRVATYEAFEPSFTGGMFVSTGDINNDGTDDYAVSADVGGGPRVRVISGKDGTVLADFLGIDDPNFRGGARTAMADLNGDGITDLVVAAGFGGGPRVAIFDGKSVAPGSTPRRLVGDFFVFEQSLRNGVYVAAGDINGDGIAELVAGAGPGGGPRVLTLDGASLMANKQVPVSDFFAGNIDNRNGVRVTVKDRDGDQFLDIVTGAGEGDGTAVTTYAGNSLRSATPSPAVIEQFDELPGQSNGVYVG